MTKCNKDQEYLFIIDSIMENEELLTGKCVVCGREAKHLVTWGIQY